MARNESIQFFEDRRIRTAWDEANEEWYFSVVDVVGVLTDSPDYNTGRKFWNKLNQRLQAIQVRKELTDEWDQQGKEYARRDHPRMVGDARYSAMVSGTENMPYSVTIDLDHVRQSSCTCPHAARRRLCRSATGKAGSWR